MLAAVTGVAKAELFEGAPKALVPEVPNRVLGEDVMTEPLMEETEELGIQPGELEGDNALAKAEIPVEGHAFVDDLFKKITLFDLKVESAKVKEIEK